jgi:hypothetical protein
MRVSNDDVNPEMPIFHSFTGLFRVFQEIALFLLEIVRERIKTPLWLLLYEPPH